MVIVTMGIVALLSVPAVGGAANEPDVRPWQVGQEWSVEVVGRTTKATGEAPAGTLVSLEVGRLHATFSVREQRLIEGEPHWLVDVQYSVADFDRGFEREAALLDVGARGIRDELLFRQTDLALIQRVRRRTSHPDVKQVRGCTAAPCVLAAHSDAAVDIVFPKLEPVPGGYRIVQEIHGEAPAHCQQVVLENSDRAAVVTFTCTMGGEPTTVMQSWERGVPWPTTTWIESAWPTTTPSESARARRDQVLVGPAGSVR